MGILFFITFSAVLAGIFYYMDTQKHNKLMLDTIAETHFLYAAVIDRKVENIREQYPLTYDITSAFIKAIDNKQTLSNIVKQSKPVTGKVGTDFSKEIDLILSRDDENAKDVVRWYSMMCLLIEAYQSNPINVSSVEKSINNKSIRNIKREDLCTI